MVNFKRINNYQKISIYVIFALLALFIISRNPMLLRLALISLSVLVLINGYIGTHYKVLRTGYGIKHYGRDAVILGYLHYFIGVLFMYCSFVVEL